jgi:prophage tail gpP-like protein
MEVVRSLEAIAGTFEVEAAAHMPGLDGRAPIRPGDACTLKLGGETVITGFVDDVALRYDARRRAVSVAGRDATGDLVDCSAVAGQYKNQTLPQLAQALVKPFNDDPKRTLPISVLTDVPAGEQFPLYEVDSGETVFEALERAARQRGVLLNSDGRGGLVLTGPATQAIATRLERGVNILAASGTASWLGRHSTITVKAQSSNPFWAAGGAANKQLGTAVDDNISRFRPLELLAEVSADGPDLQSRAEWERGVRLGRSVRVEVTVQGWRNPSAGSGQAPGGLWRPNTLIPMRDDWLDIDEPLLCAAVAYRADESGTTTLLSLTKPGAYSLLPEPATGGGIVGFGN